MTGNRSIEPILDRWLAEGPTRIADRVVFEALEIVEDTAQLRRPRWLRTNDALNQTWRLAIAAALAIVIGGAALLALAVRPGPNVGATPSPTANPSLGAAYTGRQFTPAFILNGKDSWYQYGTGGPGFVHFAAGPHEPQGPHDLTLDVIRPTQVLPVGGGEPQPVPRDLIAWLQSRSDLELLAPTTGRVGDLPATFVKGMVSPTAKVNSSGNVDLLCAAGPCGFELSNELGVTPLRHFEIAVADVRGQTVVIRIDSPGSSWVVDGRKFDAVFPTIVFPE